MTKRTTRPASAPRGAEFTAPLSIPGGGVAGAEIVRELAPELALAAWQTLRSVLMWAAEDAAARSVLFDAEAMRAWEAELLLGTWDQRLRMPLAVLVGELALGPGASPDRVARSCLCVSEWALPRNAVATTLAFAEAAALAWPEHPRYAWMAGRLLRKFGRPREAEQWIRRSIRVATVLSDWDAQTLAMNSLGNVLHESGNYPESMRVLKDTLRATRRHRLREREGQVLHDLFVAASWAGDLQRAEEFALGAYAVYGPGHSRLPALIHDVATLWIMRGQHARAHSILRDLPACFEAPEDRIRVFGGLARAAGEVGDEESFRTAWKEVWELVETGPPGLRPAAPLLEVGLGAAALRQWEQAEQALAAAVDAAGRTSEADALVRAEEALQRVRSHLAPKVPPAVSNGRTTAYDSLVADFVANRKDIRVPVGATRC